MGRCTGFGFGYIEDGKHLVLHAVIVGDHGVSLQANELVGCDREKNLAVRHGLEEIHLAGQVVDFGTVYHTRRLVVQVFSKQVVAGTRSEHK